MIALAFLWLPPRFSLLSKHLLTPQGSPPFISSSIVDYTLGPSFVYALDWSKSNVAKLSSRVVEGDTCTQKLGKLFDMPSASFCN